VFIDRNGEELYVNDKISGGTPPDRCSIAADLPGFAGVTECAVVRARETLPVTMHLDVAAAAAGIRVFGKGDSADRKYHR
jgi:hypothetical protein